MLRPINLIPSRSVDGHDGYLVEMAGTPIGAIWLPKGRGITYLVQTYLDKKNARIEGFGEAFARVVHSARFMA